MKLTSVELHTPDSSAICVLSFKDPRASNPYNVKAIAGLDAEEIISRPYGGLSKFRNLVVPKRQPIFRIGLNPRFSEGESYSSLRDDLYRMISSSRTGTIQVRFKNGTNVVAAVSGFVSKFESPQFEKTQEVILTIDCDDAELKALEPISLPTADLDTALTVISDPLSTAAHGFAFEMTFLGTLPSFTMFDPTDSSWSFTVTPNSGFLSGDVLWFSSEYNNKYLYIVRSGEEGHLADVIYQGSIWPIIFSGSNTFSVEDSELIRWDDIRYYPTYWGV